jgi:hypothetical protein
VTDENTDAFQSPVNSGKYRLTKRIPHVMRNSIDQECNPLQPDTQAVDKGLSREVCVLYLSDDCCIVPALPQRHRTPM